MARGQQAGLLHNSVTAALTITDCARSRDAGSLDHYDYLHLCILNLVLYSAVCAECTRQECRQVLNF
jgi:hypothetical protein